MASRMKDNVYKSTSKWNMPIDVGFILIIMMSDFWKKHLPFIMQIF